MFEIILKNGEVHIITEEQVKYWQMLYPKLDVEYEIGVLKELWAEGVIPKKTAKGINKYINKHLYQLGNEDL